MGKMNFKSYYSFYICLATGHLMQIKIELSFALQLYIYKRPSSH
jgi:hypothetical protein